MGYWFGWIAFFIVLFVIYGIVGTVAGDKQAAGALGCCCGGFTVLFFLFAILWGFVIGGESDWLVTTCRIIVYVYLLMLILGGPLCIISRICLSNGKEEEEKEKEEDGKEGCAICLALFLSFLFGFILDDKEWVFGWLAATSRISFYAMITLILILVIIYQVINPIRRINGWNKEKEQARLEREKEEEVKRERVATLKKVLIESGLFYEDDPWDKLYNDDGGDG